MTTRIAVLDMQPIDPPIGGGRLRLLGLYRDPGPVATVRYVGSYDWPGPGFRRQSLSARLEEVLVPLSAAHFAAAAAHRIGDIGVIDATFHRLAPLSHGAGLGLNLVREIVRLHDGNITILDSPDGGACFQMILMPTGATGRINI